MRKLLALVVLGLIVPVAAQANRCPTEPPDHDNDHEAAVTAYTIYMVQYPDGSMDIGAHNHGAGGFINVGTRGGYSVSGYMLPSSGGISYSFRDNGQAGLRVTSVEVLPCG